MAQKGPFGAMGRVLFWRYARGSWQYDVLCALILVFIFLTPKSVFHSDHHPPKPPVRAESEVRDGQNLPNPSQGDAEERPINRPE